MDAVVELHEDGRAVVNMRFGEKSVEARNFLAQIAHLIRYEGPQSEQIVFRIDARSICQAAEWRIDRKTMLLSLRGFSGQFPSKVIRDKFHWQRWRNAVLTKPQQQTGRYSPWFSRRFGFWTRLRRVQTLWMIRGFGNPINLTSLPRGLQKAIHVRERSWAELVFFAGFDPGEEATLVLRERWSRREVISRLRSLKKSGSPINSVWLQHNGYGSLHSAMSRLFGSWEAAVHAAGFYPEDEWKGSSPRLSPGEVMAEIIRRDSQGKALGTVAIRYEDWNLYVSAILHFGSWAEALKSVAIEVPRITARMSWLQEASSQESGRNSIISFLRELKARGEQINTGYLRRRYRRLEAAILYYFESWEEAVKVAGFDPGVERYPFETWDNEKVIQALIRLKSLGEPVNSGYLRESYGKLYNAMKHYFGSWQRAIEAAGFDPRNEAKRRGK